MLPRHYYRYAYAEMTPRHNILPLRLRHAYAMRYERRATRYWPECCRLFHSVANSDAVTAVIDAIAA